MFSLDASRDEELGRLHFLQGPGPVLSAGRWRSLGAAAPKQPTIGITLRGEELPAGARDNRG